MSEIVKCKHKGVMDGRLCLESGIGGKRCWYKDQCPYKVYEYYCETCDNKFIINEEHIDDDPDFTKDEIEGNGWSLENGNHYCSSCSDVRNN